MILAALLALLSNSAFAYEQSKANLYASPDMNRPHVNDIVIEGTPNGVPRSIVNVIQELPATFSSVGGLCDGSSLIDNIWTSLASTPRKLVITDGANCRVASNIKLPKGKDISVEGSGRITVDAGKVLTILGRFDAPLRRVFAGSGTVQGMKVNRPEWWGAGNTYDATAASRNDAAALNAAFASAAVAIGSDGASDGGRPSVALSGYYYICSQLDLRPSPAIGLSVEGTGQLAQGGSIITCPSGFSGAAAVAIHGLPTAGGAFTGTDMSLRNLNIVNTAGSGAPIGISFVPEGAGYALAGGLHQQIVENVSVNGFPINWKIQNMRLVLFKRISSWGGAAVKDHILVTVSDAASFTGDLDFENVNIAGCMNSTDTTVFTSTSGACYGTSDIHVVSAVSGAQIKGVRIGGTLYSAAKYLNMEATHGGVIGDFWVQPGTQFDGFGCTAISTTAVGKGSYIDNLQVRSAYIRGVDAGCQAIFAAATDGGTVRTLSYISNWLANLGDTAGNFYGTRGVTFSLNQIFDSGKAGANAVIFSFSTDFNATGNTILHGGGLATRYDNGFHVTLDSNYGVISSNTCGAVKTSCVLNQNPTSKFIQIPANMTANH